MINRTQKEMINIRINGSFFYIDCNQAVLDSGTNQYVFLSGIQYSYHVKEFLSEFKREKCLAINSNCRHSIGRINYCDVDIEEKSLGDLTHVIIKRKNSDINNYQYFFSTKEDEEEALQDMKNKLLDYIKESTPIPFLDEWIDYVYDKLFTELSYTDNSYDLCVDVSNLINDKDIIKVLKTRITERNLVEIIEEGLKNHDISINGCNEKSELINTVSGLNDYLDVYKESLAKKIKETFSPKFDPEVDSYDKYVNIIDDFVSSKDNVELYEAQKCTIQAIVNNMKINNVTNVIGECGSGKSIIAATSVFAHNANNKKGFNTIVMCPPHLVNKWKREIEDRIPNSRAYIVSNFSDILDLKSKLLNKNKTECSYLIISKESAKLGYETRPAAIWNERKKAFVCPNCGKVLQKEITEKIYNRREKIKVNIGKLEFVNKNSFNQKCIHCKSPVWTAVNKDELVPKWYKISGIGWIHKNTLESIFEELKDDNNELSLTKKKRQEYIKKIKLFKSDMKSGKVKDKYRGSKKYPTSKYIKKYLKNVFDYCILDEAHELKGESAQGYASYDLIKSSKKTLLLTGTLLNGYADSIFYLLFRTNSELMIKEGFKYSDSMEFARIYGVISKERVERVSSSRYERNTTISAREKKLPGVSPLVFTKFLLNNSVFLSLSDMEDGLPDYNEYPVGVYMDEELENGYNEIEEELRNVMRHAINKKAEKRMALPFLQEAIIYPDSPSSSRIIYNPETGEEYYKPKVFESKRRNKDMQLLNIVREKIENGEKVLVYYNSVNKTDIGNHLINMFKEESIYADELKSSEKASNREEWIKTRVNKGLKVLICNPKLVETGLDLLDFTTIVFYQVGYNLFTLRQASRRSWRLSQTKPISVYFLYYRNTIQEQALSLMATKLHASMAIEGKFSEEGLRALSNNEDVLTKIAKNVVEGIQDTVDESMFNTTTKTVREKSNKQRIHKRHYKDIEFNLGKDGFRLAFNRFEFNKNNNYINIKEDYVKNPLLMYR